MTDEKSNRPMTEKERLTHRQLILRNSIDSIRTILNALERRDFYGPLEPAMQHLEEAGFWLGRCELIYASEITRITMEQKEAEEL